MKRRTDYTAMGVAAAKSVLVELVHLLGSDHAVQVNIVITNVRATRPRRPYQTSRQSI